ncbi:formyltransferase family protein [Terasakiella sp. A23]|uniref:methionyl-tRNA formyltransferase n=1 Tax=Terasakiella sp. FCG-A23 TaxID=3080561 RepID=UPI002953FEC7|nr:formyltransferase family protein [Terasakiella sp. A23]MDV7338457.1 formyltransferase family protein [Terasakiella sp. A23]
MPKSIEKMLIFGDEIGVNQILHYLPANRIAGVVAAFNRPEDITKIEKMALEKKLPMLVQPPRKDEKAWDTFIENVRDLKPDGLICNSYSLLISDDLLSFVEGCAFNIHYSLLPRNRGPHPIEWVLKKKEDVTGVTVHVMSAEFDKGDIIAQIPVNVLDTDTPLSLAMSLYKKSIILMETVLPRLVSGQWAGRPQDENLATHNAPLSKEEIEILHKG